MPRRTVFLPTPASSAEIKGRDGPALSPPSQTDFELPEPAMRTSPSDIVSVLPRKKTKPPEREPPSYSSSARASFSVQPGEMVKPRRRVSLATTSSSWDPIALPPPPTRARKIIQMDIGSKGLATTSPAVTDPPLAHHDNSAMASAKRAADGKGRDGTCTGGTLPSTQPSESKPDTTATLATSASKRKQHPSATNAAGRKIARKTAHSLIERRRRSKMNEEFALLKSMIPACTGEVHKLAILQANYIHYLQDCIAKLQAAHQNVPIEPYCHDHDRDHDHDQDQNYDNYICNDHDQDHSSVPNRNRDEDVDMTAPTTQQPSPTHSSTSSAAAASAIAPDDDPSLRARFDAHLYDVSPVDFYSATQRYSHQQPLSHHSHSYAASTDASPTFGPQTPHVAGHPHPVSMAGSATASTSTSPALLPAHHDRELDRQAMAALMMLNADRGSTTSAATPRVSGGLSVKDLLST